MSYYPNFKFADGEQLALEVATVGGWADFVRWARAATLKTLLTLARSGTWQETESVRHNAEARTLLTADTISTARLTSACDPLLACPHLWA
jgi:hypothetical protein